ncbi:hypothetical protein N9L47_09335, partial [Rhodobacteraceae bacterium]|nr:hypothetical protein [Paracoccaceae bacterium]
VIDRKPMYLNLEYLKSALRELSDQSEQMRLWADVRNNTDQQSSMQEAFCYAFDDTGLSPLLDDHVSLPGLTEEQVSKLKQLSGLGKAVPYSKPVLEQIESREMKRVRPLASEILAMFPKNGGKPNDR